jgi:hypothetical protein
MATLRERMRARREAERRGLRSFTIGLSEDDLRVIAKRGYEGSVTTDHISRRKLSACSSTMSFCKSDRVNRRSNVSRDGVTSRTVSPCRAGHGSSVTISKDEFAEIAR